tara:strand:- start:2423 stop:2593 length:171 start_codon:yes stop_codon:yes gene_type:complete
MPCQINKTQAKRGLQRARKKINEICMAFPEYLPMERMVKIEKELIKTLKKMGYVRK